MFLQDEFYSYCIMTSQSVSSVVKSPFLLSPFLFEKKRKEQKLPGIDTVEIAESK